MSLTNLEECLGWGVYMEGWIVDVMPRYLDRLGRQDV